MADEGNKPKEEQKDLTSLLQHSKALEESGHAPAVPDGSVMEEVPIEKIDDFESLEDYAVTNPPPDLPPEPSLDSAESSDASSAPPPPASFEAPEAIPTEASADLNSPPPSSEFADASAFATTPPESTPSEASDASPQGNDSHDFPASSEAPPSGDLSTPSGSSDFPDSPKGATNTDAFNMGEPPSSDFQAPSSAPTDESAQDASHGLAQDFSSAPEAVPADAILAPPTEAPEMASPSAAEPPHSSPSSPIASSQPSEASPTVLAPSSPSAPSGVSSPQSQRGLSGQPGSAPQFKQLGPSQSPLEQLRDFAEKEAPAKPNVPASFPFSLLITGHLLPEEKEKLLDLITRENMGIREIDLEPQFQGGRILIPRISEFAAVMIVQALRGIRAQIKMGPSDQIFATTDTRDETSASSNSENVSVRYISDLEHPAENLPITSENHLQNQPFDLIDMVSASAALRSDSIEAESTTEYQQIVEALQREIKYKAFRKGAIAIINFKIQLTMLTSPTHYRVTVLGTAVGKRPNSNPSPNLETRV